LKFLREIFGNFFFLLNELKKKADSALCCTGAHLQEKTKPHKKYVFIKNLSDWLDEEFFETMKVVHLPV